MKNLLLLLIPLFMLSVTSCEKSTSTVNLPEITYTSNYQAMSTLWVYCHIDEGESGDFITEYGLCYSESPNPTIDDSHKDLGSGVFAGYLQYEITIPSGEYYFKIYAINSSGVSYGPNVTVVVE